MTNATPHPQHGVGDHIHGHDPYYVLDLAGVVEEIREDRAGNPEYLFVNDLPGPLEGKRVSLPERWVKGAS